MPTYEYKCRDCGEYTKKVNRIAQRKNLTPKCQCGGATDFRISMPMINSVSAMEFNNYQCPVTDQIVTSQKQKREIEAANGLIIKEKGIYPPRKKNKFVDETPEILKPEIKKYMAQRNATI